MKVRMLESVGTQHGTYQANIEYDLADHYARKLVSQGFAKFSDPPAPETTMEAHGQQPRRGRQSHAETR